MKVKRIDVNGFWKVFLEDGSKWELRPATVHQMDEVEYDSLLTFMERLTKKRDVERNDLLEHGFGEVP